MNESLYGQDQVEALAEEFLGRRRQGERPTIAEYAAKYPALADAIRACFPALLLVEDLKPDPAEAAGAPGPAGPGPPLERLGDYRLLREVGRGGMGVVYEAEQESLGRHVALKVLPAHALLDPKHLQRFVREAKAAARLHHTNIVPVFGVGEDVGLHYYVMQFIQGQALDQVLDELRRLRKQRNGAAATPAATQHAPAAQIAEALLTGSFSVGPGAAPPSPLPLSPQGRGVGGEGSAAPPGAPLAVAPPVSASTTSVHLPGQAERSSLSGSGREYWQSVARVGVQVAEALAHAHGQGVLHRDIKPSNLLLDTRGTVWVTDFGLAKAADSDDLTHTGDIVGTLRYMAPERLRGQSGPRGDLYGLGVTLYELLTLRPAFTEPDRHRLFQRVLHEEPPAPRQLNAEVPRDLETIILKAIAKEPGQRYASAADLAEDLRRFLADRPVRARRASWVERLGRWARRNKTAAALLATIAISVLLVTGLSLAAAYRLSRVADQARQAERDAWEGLFRSSFAQAQALRHSGQMGHRWAALEALRRAADLARSLDLGDEELLPMRNEAIACLALSDMRLGKEWEASPPGSIGLGFSPSYDMYAQCFRDGRIRLHRLADDREVRALRFPPRSVVPGDKMALSFSPRGRYLAGWLRFLDSHREQPFYLWDLEHEGDAPLLELSDVTSFWSFSADETRLAVAGRRDGQDAILLRELPSRRELQRLPARRKPERVALDPAGRSLAVACPELPEVDIIDTGDGRQLQKLPHPAGVIGLAWTPDGRTLATGGTDDHVYVWDVATGKRRADLQGHSWDVYDLAFSPGGDLLVSQAWDRTLRLWDPWLHKQLLSVPSAGLLAVSRDGRFAGAVWRGPAVRLCGLIPSPEFRVLRGPTGPVYGLAFDADGRLLAGTGSDNVHVWDVGTGRQLAALDNTLGHFVLFQAHPPGLLTNCDGILRYRPVQAAPPPAESPAVGPPRELMSGDFFKGSGRMCWCGSVQTALVIADQIGGAVSVFDLGEAPRRRHYWPYPHCHYVASTPDGHWVAAGTRDGRGVRVWDADSGALAREWTFGDAQAAFSPDGRWLALTPSRVTEGGAECSLWRVGTWEKGPAFPLDRTSAPAGLAFSDDGRLLAVCCTMTDIALLDPNDLHELARLQAPEPLLLECPRFSPDGSRLAVGMGKAGAVGVWDLRLIWQELAEMGLDRGLPPLAPK
jgi:serine/threonine protein kinase/WD40 repeat protein